MPASTMSAASPSVPPAIEGDNSTISISGEPPVVAAVATQDETPSALSSADDEVSIWREFWRTSPTWGISMLVHIILVLALTLYTTAEVLKPGTSILTASMEDAPEAIEEQTDEVLKLEELEISPTSIDAPNPSDSIVDLSKTAMTPEKPDIAAQSELPALTDFGDPANGLLGEIGEAMSDKAGAGNTATFFGVPAKGKKFCFVVDNSRSMRGAKFENAIYELGMAIDKLNASQSFYIVFFSDQPYPLFYPQSAEVPILATPQNKQRLAKWLPTVELHLKTKGSEAMKIALDLNVDAIYLLGDGAFTDNAVKELMDREPTRTKIHTIGFNMKEGSRPAKDFEEIAKKFYGTYRSVNEPGK